MVRYSLQLALQFTSPENTTVHVYVDLRRIENISRMN